jgi:citrate lyase beta subunit
MRRTMVTMRRLVLLAFAASGLLALSGCYTDFMQQQHCEPVLRH